MGISYVIPIPKLVVYRLKCIACRLVSVMNASVNMHGFFSVRGKAGKGTKRELVSLISQCEETHIRLFTMHT